MSRVSVKLEMWGDAKGAPVKVAILDSNFNTVEVRWMDGHHLEVFDLDEGMYGIHVSLPSGRVIHKGIKVGQNASLDIRIPVHRVSPHEQHEWAYVTKAIDEASVNRLDETRYAGVWARMWIRNPDTEWRVEPLDSPNRLCAEDDGVTFRLNFFEEGQYLLQTGGEHVPWKLVSIPPRKEVMVLIRPASGPGDRVHPLDVIVSSDDWELESLLSMIRRGNTDDAEDLLKQKNLADLAEEKLKGKMADPYGAAIGGYALLHLNALAKMHDWANNLAEWFDWIPDGAIIHGCQLLEDASGNVNEEQRNRGISQARHRFIEAERRGIPLVTEGLMRLRNGLLAFHRNDKDDTEVSEALARIGGYTAACDRSTSTIIFTGSHPTQPSPEPPVGVPEDELPLSFVYDIPVSGAIDMGVLSVDADLSALSGNPEIKVHINDQEQIEFSDGRVYGSLGAWQSDWSESPPRAPETSESSEATPKLSDIKSIVGSLRFKSFTARKRKR